MESHMPIAIQASQTADNKVKSASRLLYIDNLRIYLTLLVIAHHLMVIYANSGGWIYHEGRQDEITSAIGGWFCSVNQAYFMGLFLFIAAYFVPGAYDRKGPAKFLVDRLIRLGIPLVFYGWMLRPVLIFVGEEGQGYFWNWYRTVYFAKYGIIGGGPLWFIEALLIFSLSYALIRFLGQKRISAPVEAADFPKSGMIILFTVFLGIASFLIRIFSPVNETIEAVNLQPANFAQYIALFVSGLLAYRFDWLSALPDQVGKRWLKLAVLLVLIYPPLGLLAMSFGGTDPFLGGWHWQSLLFSQWESFLCVSACIGLIAFFRGKMNQQGKVAKELSRSAYATYLLHEPVITFAAVFTEGILIYPLLKFGLALVAFTPLCFFIGGMVRRIPYVDRVL